MLRAGAVASGIVAVVGPIENVSYHAPEFPRIPQTDTRVYSSRFIDCNNPPITIEEQEDS